MLETFSNTAHLHLLLNHVPTVGYAAALAIFLLGWRLKSDDVVRASLALFFVIAVISIATYVTGNAAEIRLGGGDAKRLGFGSDVDAGAIRIHEDAALW